MKSISNSLSSNVIRTLFFFIQSLSRIMFLEIDLTYMIIYCWLSEILNCFFIYSLKIIFSFVTILVSVSYLIEIILSLFFWIHILDIIVIFVSKSISLFLVTVLSSLFRIVIERVIRFSSFSFSSFLELSRFSIRRRLRKWSSFI